MLKGCAKINKGLSSQSFGTISVSVCTQKTKQMGNKSHSVQEDQFNKDFSNLKALNIHLLLFLYH